MYERLLVCMIVFLRALQDKHHNGNEWMQAKLHNIFEITRHIYCTVSYSI